jgi:hypothetical protein
MIIVRTTLFGICQRYGRLFMYSHVEQAQPQPRPHSPVWNKVLVLPPSDPSTEGLQQPPDPPPPYVHCSGYNQSFRLITANLEDLTTGRSEERGLYPFSMRSGLLQARPTSFSAGWQRFSPSVLIERVWVTFRYHCGGWSEEVNSCILIISYMVYL